MITTILIAAIIGAVIAFSWYNKQKQALREEYLKEMEHYLNQLEEPQQQQTALQYTMFFKVGSVEKPATY